MEAKQHLHWLLCWLFFIFAGMVSSSQAADLAVVSHKKSGSVIQLAERLSDALQQDVDVQLIDDDISGQNYKVVILTGPKAVIQWQGKQPAVAVFINASVAHKHADKLESALYVEPPFPRQIGLAKAILGDDRPLGVLASSADKWNVRQYRGKPLSSALITPYFVDQYENLNRALIDLLRNNHALIGIYDPHLYSSNNIKNILITAYRQNKPLIGPSSAYIKAGALATTYSDLDDVVKRLKEIILAGLREGNWPEPGYNPYFKVRYNEQVGRSLNLLLPPVDKLQTQLMQQEAGQ